jgi:hypothetical protein
VVFRRNGRHVQAAPRRYNSRRSSPNLRLPMAHHFEGSRTVRFSSAAERTSLGPQPDSGLKIREKPELPAQQRYSAGRS